MSFKNKLHDAGYDPEELYFKKADQEAIEKMRSKKKSHLKLLPGGKTDQPKELLPPVPSGVGRKAA